MTQAPDPPILRNDEPGGILIVEGAPGPDRRRFLERALEESDAPPEGRWYLSCDFSRGGLWAGVRELVGDLVERHGFEDLLQRYDYELVQVLPSLKRRITVRNPTLTDTSPPTERVRNYPADRAYRMIHGLVELLAAWKLRVDERPWTIVVDDLDRGSRMGQVFLRELVRRRGRALRLTLIAAVSSGAAGTLEAILGAAIPCTRIELDPPDRPAAPEPEDPAAARTAAEALEAEVEAGSADAEESIPELIHLWRTAGDPDRLATWLSKAQTRLNILGFYQDSLSYGYELLGLVRTHDLRDAAFRWDLFNKIFFAHVALGEAEEARALVDSGVAGPIDSPLKEAQYCYLMAMLFGRYLADRDLERAESYLESGLEAIESAEVDEARRHFETVFNRNGLAMVRHFQGRFDEAIELCRSGYRQLTEHLGASEHRLHRSVLLYNIAQVLAALRRYDEALEHYSTVIEMDPNYSEYYNEVGNIQLRRGRTPEAEAAYRRAIELSPPYHEVWVNLGQCLNLQERFGEAVEAYDRALDLEPEALLALLGRAQALEALARTDEALADYDTALALAPDEWQALANRASLRFEAGDLQGSLDDLSRAIELQPDLGDLYRNRALVFESLGDRTAMADDLERCVHRMEDSPERAEVATELARARDGLEAGVPREATAI